MKITEVKDLSKYLIGAFPFGVGTTAICFLMPNKKVLKMYYKEEIRQTLMKKIDLLEKSGNESFIAPEELLIKDNKCIAQIYDYVDAPTLSSIKRKYSVSDILIAYDKLVEDIKRISDNRILLADLHEKNILFDGAFYIIDLDRVKTDEKLSEERIFMKNMGNVNEIILNSLFRLRYYEIIDFTNPDIQELHNSARCDQEKFKLLLNRIITDTNDSKIRKISRKIGHEKYINSYKF